MPGNIDTWGKKGGVVQYFVGPPWALIKATRHEGNRLFNVFFANFMFSNPVNVCY